MNFLEKLNYLMEKNHLNKSTLSKSCNIPYTTIDGWYKKGYEGLKLTTLRKLADFFDTSLDYWASDDDETSQPLASTASNDPKTDEALSLFLSLRPEFQEYALEQIKKLAELQNKT